MKHFDSDNVHIWFDESRVNITPSLLFDITYWQKNNAIIGSAEGRGTTWFVDLKGIPAAFRHYRRGGLFGKLIKDSYWFTTLENTRSYAEYQLLSELSSAGVNVPKPIAARAQKNGLTYQADLLTEKIHNAKDLVDLLLDRALAKEQYHQIGQEIQKMHRVGVNHTDLNIHNILLDDQDNAWIIDFDKCYKQLGDSWKESNLDRLLRSFRKELDKRHIHWQESDFKSLLAGYHSVI
ncbi:3-deoxy-D-manno-octulosonic acid kinase [Vibrio tasmaniensis]|nr:3-deoxy-D-manno-octulosonic acid kinase [Vibrio tasmaniensis]